MSEVDRARRLRERGDGRTWRERALDSEADVEQLREQLHDALKVAATATAEVLRLREENKRLSEALSWADVDIGAIIRETEAE